MTERERILWILSVTVFPIIGIYLIFMLRSCEVDRQRCNVVKACFTSINKDHNSCKELALKLCPAR